MEWVAIMGLSVTMLTVIVSGTAWAVRQQGRIDGHDKLFEERKEQVDDKIDAFCDLQQQRHEDLIRRLERIERKQDSVNGAGLDKR